MPPDTSDILNRLNTLSPPARQNLFMFLELSAAFPGSGFVDESAYFKNLLELRRIERKRASA